MPIPANIRAILDELDNALSVAFEVPTAPEPPVVEEPPVVIPTPGRYGKHWPSNTPLRGNPDVTVDASWSAIEKALKAGAKKIAVKSGALPGTGFGSSSAPVLQGIDRRGGQKALVYPLNGYGSVTVGDLNFREVHGVAFIGFDAAGKGVMFANCFDSAWGWGEIDHMRVTAHQGKASSGIEWVEPVSLELVVKGDDRHRFITAGAGSKLSDVTIIGGYGAPIYRPTGSGTHCDYLQLEAQTGGGAITNIRIEDHITFGASNQTIQSSNSTVVLKDAVILGGSAGEKRYPRPSNADKPSSAPSALNGTASATVEGSTVIVGPVRPGWTLRGSYAVSISDSELNSKYPKPTKAELKKAWS